MWPAAAAGPAPSPDRLLLAKPPDVRDHDGHGGSKQQDGDGAGAAEVAGREHLLVHPVGNHFGVEVAVRHDIHDIERLQRKDHHRRRHDGDGGAEGGEDEPSEDLPFGGTIHPRRFQQLGRDALQRRREDDQAKTRPHPHAHRDERKVVGEQVHQPGHRAEPREERREGGIQDPDLRRAGRAELVHELPDHARRHEGDRHGQKDDRLGRGLVPDPVREHGQQQAGAHREPREAHQPEEIVAKRNEHLAVGERENIIPHSHEGGGSGAQDTEVDGIHRRIDQECGEEGHSRRGIMIHRPVGGLAAALDPVMQAAGGTWVAWGSGDADFEVADEHGHVRVPPRAPAYTLRRVPLSDDEVDGFYYGYANQALWPLCHLATQHARFRQQHWEAYQAVNRRFATATLAEVAGDAIVWVHDYHLTLCPRYLRQGRPQVFVMTFWHIPSPAWDVV